MELGDMLAEAVRKDSIRVPPYPMTAMKLQQVLSKSDYAQSDLVNAMRTDAVFTGNLLRLANSPFYRRGEAVTSLQVAVGRIGAKELTRLAMAATVTQASSGAGPLAQLRRGLWRQSLSAALVTEALSKVDGADGGEGFVAGLLHDVGKLLVVGSIEDAIAKGASPDSAAIARALESQHLALGRVLAARWQLPEALVTVITRHHEDPLPDALTKRVALADRIVDALEQQATLTTNDLSALTGLAAPACEALAQMLPGIPATITAFETESVEPEPSSTGAFTTPLPAMAPKPGLREVAFSVELKRANKPLHVDVCRADATTFSGLSREALEPNRLLEFEVVGASMKVWAVVQRARKIGELFDLECSLYAASPEIARAWQQLLERSVVRPAA
ncbi:MAG: HDOD domain-containing protein [Archangiaceae bacterium]|nr:HDOD domain-containing protein [Archangiaceae bacterium]